MISLCWLSQPPCLWNPQTGLVQDVCATGLCLALEQSHKHILNVLHQSPPVPQSHVTSLILASSIFSVSSSAWGLVMPRAFARVRSRNHHQIFRQISIVDLTRILLVLSRLSPTQVRFLVLSLRPHPLFSSDHPLYSCSRRTFRIVAIIIGLHVFNNVAFLKFLSPKFSVHVLQRSSPRLF